MKTLKARTRARDLRSLKAGLACYLHRAGWKQIGPWWTHSSEMGGMTLIEAVERQMRYDERVTK